jgi:predicted outer membrane repeat protein
MHVKSRPNARTLKNVSIFETCLARGLLIAIAFFMTSGVAQARVRWVGASSGCDSTTIQDAINRASNGDEVRITKDGGYLGEWYGQALFINNKNLTIGGNWDYCGQPDAQYPVGYQVVSGYDNPSSPNPAPVITIRGASNVSLYGLLISLGDPSGASSRGGGIDFRGRGNLSLRTVILQYNVAVSGGAIYISCNEGNGALCNGPVNPSPTSLTLRDNVYIYDNTAYFGGGLYVNYGAKLVMKNAYTFFHRNHAVDNPTSGENGRGGAIYFYAGGTADIGSPHPAGTAGVFYQNTATGSGGAIYVGTEDGFAPSAPINLYSTSAAEPLSFIENQAFKGAAVAMYSTGYSESGTTVVCATHVNFRGNRRDPVGNFSTAASIVDVFGARSLFAVNSVDCLYQLPDDAVACGPLDQTHCDEFSENEAQVLMKSGGGGDIFLRRVRVDHNNLRNKVLFTYGNLLSDLSVTGIYDSVIDNNTAMMGIVEASGGGAAILNHVTIAGNSHPLQPVLTNLDSILYVRKSIIDQEDSATLFEGNIENTILSFVLASNASGYSEINPNLFLGRPSYIPGFYRLQPYSAGIDLAPVSAEATDPDGTPRSIDNASIQNTPGYYADLGAFESSATFTPPELDRIFASSFDPIVVSPH